MSVQTHSNNLAHCLQAGSNPNVSFLSHSCHTITTNWFFLVLSIPFFPTLLPQSSFSTPHNTYTFTLSGSKLHCHLQFFLSHFLPFSKQRSDLGSVICLPEHFFSKPSSVTLTFTAFYSSTSLLFIFFPPPICSKLLCNISHFASSS